MSAEVKEPTYGGVSVNDPRIREAIRTMKQRGYDTEYIVRIVGMPKEVIDKHLREITS